MLPKSPIAARIASGPRISHSPLPIVAKSTDWRRSSADVKTTKAAAAISKATLRIAIAAAPRIVTDASEPIRAITAIVAKSAIPAFNKACQGIAANIVNAKAIARIDAPIASSAKPPFILPSAIFAATAIARITPPKATIAARRESQGSCARTNKDPATAINGKIIASIAQIPFLEPLPALFAILTANAIASITPPIATITSPIENAVLSIWSTGINCSA